MRRKPERRSSSSKKFKKGLGTNKKNIYKVPTRGGHRL